MYLLKYYQIIIITTLIIILLITIKIIIIKIIIIVIIIVIIPSGSDHNRSHIGPSCGTSCFLSIVRICEKKVDIYLCDVDKQRSIKQLTTE